MKILLVEDDHLLAKDLMNQLKELGYVDVYWASGVEKALLLFKKVRPEIAIIDIHLGQDSIDGVELALRFRQTSQFSLIYLTGYRDEATSARAQICKPSSTLIKPVHRGQIQTALELAARDWNRVVLNEARSSGNGSDSGEGMPVFVKVGKKYIRLNWESILWIEASSSSVIIQMGGERICVGKNLKSFLKDCPYNGLVRVHRSYAVNLQYVQSFDDEFVFVAKGDIESEIPCSRGRRGELHARMRRLLTNE